MRVGHCQGRPRQTRQNAANHQALVPHFGHADSQRINSLRRHSHRPDAQSPGGAEQHEPGKRHKEKREIHDHIMIEQHRPQDRDIAEHRDLPRLQALYRLDSADIKPEKQAGQAPAQHGQTDPADSLLGLQCYTDKRHQQSHQSTGHDRRRDAQYRGIRHISRVKAAERAHQHDAFQPQIIYAGTLRQHFPQRSQQIRNGQPNPGRDDADEDALLQKIRHVTPPPRNGGDARF